MSKRRQADAARAAIDAVAVLARELDAYRMRYLKLEERMKEADAAASVPIYPVLTDLVTAAMAGDEAGIAYYTVMFKRRLAMRRIAPPPTVYTLLMDPRFMAGTARIRFHSYGHPLGSVEADAEGGYLLLAIHEATGIITELLEEDDCDASGDPEPTPWRGWFTSLTYEAEIVGPRPHRVP